MSKLIEYTTRQERASGKQMAKAWLVGRNTVTGEMSEILLRDGGKPDEVKNAMVTLEDILV